MAKQSDIAVGIIKFIKLLIAGTVANIWIQQTVHLVEFSFDIQIHQ